VTIVRVDINCDLGEIDTTEARATDAALLDLVSSANIACGGHAGDASSMARTIELAMARGVAIGAHPSYPDRENFGRIEISMSDDDIEREVASQIHALAMVAQAAGAAVRHVKPHGALYHAAMVRPGVAHAIARASLGQSKNLVLVGLAGAPGLDVWKSMGCRTASEAFADRRYEPDGTLRSRTRGDALIADPEEAANQAARLVQGFGSLGSNGPSSVPQTICIHGDSPNCVQVAGAVRRKMRQLGVRVEPLETGLG
jgi:UPF0271 protein